VNPVRGGDDRCSPESGPHAGAAPSLNFLWVVTAANRWFMACRNSLDLLQGEGAGVSNAHVRSRPRLMQHGGNHCEGALAGVKRISAATFTTRR
jgi:hypothetical protein